MALETRPAPAAVDFVKSFTSVQISVRFCHVGFSSSWHSLRSHLTAMHGAARGAEPCKVHFLWPGHIEIQVIGFKQHHTAVISTNYYGSLICMMHSGFPYIYLGKWAVFALEQCLDEMWTQLELWVHPSSSFPWKVWDKFSPSRWHFSATQFRLWEFKDMNFTA